jgi:cation transport ATPase
MRIVSAFAIASGLFLTGFFLHIVGGATDTDWLFQFAVVMIVVTATGFPATVMAFADLHVRSSGGRRVMALAFACGYALTLATLWAASDRSSAAWQFPAAAVMVIVVSGLKLGLDLVGGGRSLRRA